MLLDIEQKEEVKPLQKTIAKIDTIGFRQLIKHYTVGLIGQIINYTIFNILSYCRFSIAISNSVTCVFVVTITFLLQKYFTYKVQENIFKQFFLFIIAAIIYFTTDTILLKILINMFGIVPTISKLITIIILSPLSFIFQKLFIFSEK